jgi:hypothetical protein
VAPGAGIFTSVCEQGDNDEDSLIGQAIQNQGSPLAQMTFLAPRLALTSKDLSSLVEYMVGQAGERGALRLLADVEDHCKRLNLAKTGFCHLYPQRTLEDTRSGE